MRSNAATYERSREETIVLYGSRCFFGTQETVHASIQICNGRIERIVRGAFAWRTATPPAAEIDLAGYLVLPGLINAHDHLEFALFPRLADPPYRNYVEWGEDIHNKFPAIIAKHRAVPKEARLWWGGIKNLLCGVTTVSQHNPLWPELTREDFPVRVVQEYGWGHSFALGGDLRTAHAATPKERAFVVHACEGVDALAREELWELDKLGLLDANTALVHGLAVDRDGAKLLSERKASLILCPSSNDFLFGRLPDLSVLGKVERVALGNDSPLTAAGDLLDEIRFALRRCAIAPATVYDMVTRIPAAILHLDNGEGTIEESGVADLIAIRDTGATAAERHKNLSMEDIELVMIGGRLQLASETIMERLPLAAMWGLEPLSIGAAVRWLRVPARELLQTAQEVLGTEGVQLSGKIVRTPAFAEAEHAC